MLYQNEVVLLGHYGGDETHAMSAWTSTKRDLDAVEKKGPNKGKTRRERVPSMLKDLADHGHGTPFEKSALHFLMTTEIATHIHVLKHRIAVSVNAESARYKELEDKFLLPTDWPAHEREKLFYFCKDAFAEYRAVVDRLEPLLGRKRAKESARFYLPYATQIVADVQFNFRSFVAFLKLRYSEHAQKEVREIAFAMLDRVVSDTDGAFDHSLRAFGLVLEDGSIREPFA